MQDQIRWQLGQDVRNVCHGERLFRSVHGMPIVPCQVLTCLILVVTQSKITLQACYAGVANVGSVDSVSITVKPAFSHLISHLSRKASRYSKLMAGTKMRSSLLTVLRSSLLSGGPSSFASDCMT
jgi:hypothetical protein